MAQEAIFEDVEGTFIGIDLGTSNSVVTYFKDNKFEQVKFGRNKILPSVIFYEAPNKKIFGEKALKKGVVYPESLIREFKRDLGTKIKYNLTFKNENEDKEMIFVIDTNVFINSPLILSIFSENDEVKLPNTVISELSNQEQNNEDIKEAASIALEEIQKYINEPFVELEESHLELLSSDLTENSRNDNNDNRILSIAKFHKENSDKEVFLITNDNGLRLKAEGEGIAVFNETTLKQLIEDKTNDSFKVTPKTATKELLGYIKDVAESEVGIIQKALITVPANFNPSQISLVKEAGEEAGFDEIAIQKEPVAVGLAYALDEKDDKLIMVYDFGGGTFDVSFLEIKDGKISVLGTDGDPKLGGKDVTQKIIEIIYVRLDEDYDLDMFDESQSGLSSKTYKELAVKIKAEAERVKVALSEYEEEEINLPNLYKANEEFDKDINLSFKLSRKDFEVEIAEIRKKSLDVVKKLMSDLDITPQDIDEIIMAGGTSSIPSIRESLKDTLGKEPTTKIDTSVVISYGACVEALRKWSDSETIQEKIIIIDNALHDFGVEIKDYKFDTLIPNGSELPIQVTKEYTTQKDNQENIVIKVFQRKATYQNVTKTYEDGIEMVDEIKISGIPPRAIGDITISVTFELTKDDALEVSVEVKEKDGSIIENKNIKVSKASNV